MKVTVINGNLRHGSTWHSADAVIKEIGKLEEVSVSEFFLPKAMPHFCCGCFSCITKGEASCPHAEAVKPILDSILEADLIVLTSPIYAMNVSAQMKALLDHLCFMWMSHRPNPLMFEKIGLTVSTTAGAGLGQSTKAMRDSLTFWGSKKVYSLKSPVSAMSWDAVKENRKRSIEKSSARLARRIVASYRKRARITNPLFRSFFFSLMRGMMRKNDWNLTDRNHWEDNGWLNGAKPF